ncbi:DMT family transporter [Laceyella putida]|uniref:DMT family transporter n=1 Tax=Laceyella putida TaxID=110101 RepID=A0ABW2RMF9_9BACL
MQKWIGPICLSIAAAIWGGMYVVSKVVLAKIPPWVLLELRFLLAFIVLGLWAGWKREWKVANRDLVMLGLIGLIGYTGSIGFQFVGTSLSGAAMGSLITSASPALISLFAWWLLREQMSARKIVSITIATLGVLIVSDLSGISSDPSTATTWGNLALIAAAVTWALYTVLSRVQTRKYTSLTVTLWASLFGVLFTAPIAWHEAQTTNFSFPMNPWLWLGIVYLGVISTALAFYLWNKGFEYTDAATGSLFFFLQPIVGSLLGAWLLGERLTVSFFIGAVCIGIGVYLSIGGQEKNDSP